MYNTRGFLAGALAVGALAVGCTRSRDGTVTSAEQRAASASPSASASASASARAEADNTARNERDRDPEHPTPLDQKENEVDLGISQKIRQGVVGSNALSMTAKNVKIITADGVVTLRGPVTSQAEKDQIAGIANQTAGVKRVDNQLEIAAK